MRVIIAQNTKGLIIINLSIVESSKHAILLNNNTVINTLKPTKIRISVLITLLLLNKLHVLSFQTMDICFAIKNTICNLNMSGQSTMIYTAYLSHPKHPMSFCYKVYKYQSVFETQTILCKEYDALSNMSL